MTSSSCEVGALPEPIPIASDSSAPQSTCLFRLLALFDFDWSLLNCNSDTWIIEQLAPELMKQMPELSKRSEFAVWTDLMNETMRQLHCEPYSIRRQQLDTAFSRAPMFNEIHEILHLLSNNQEHRIFESDMYIISDANQFFIESILKHRKLIQYFQTPDNNDESTVNSHIITNGSRFDDDERLHVTYQQLSELPVACPNMCPRNMCKGSILDSIMSSTKYQQSLSPSSLLPLRRVLLGDGLGDWCAASRLSSHDAVLCRKDFPLHKEIVRQQTQSTDASKSKSKSSRLPIAAQIHIWSNGPEMLACYQKILHNWTSELSKRVE